MNLKTLEAEGLGFAVFTNGAASGFFYQALQRDDVSYLDIGGLHYLEGFGWQQCSLALASYWAMTPDTWATLQTMISGEEPPAFVYSLEETDIHAPEVSEDSGSDDEISDGILPIGLGSLFPKRLGSIPWLYIIAWFAIRLTTKKMRKPRAGAKRTLWTIGRTITFQKS